MDSYGADLCHFWFWHDRFLSGTARVGAKRAGGTIASWSNPHGSCPGDYRPVGNGPVVDLSMDIASQVTPGRTDQRVNGP